MNLGLVAGPLLTAAGLVAYAAGIAVPYPGRSLSLAAVMVEITVTLVSRGREAPS